MASPTLCLRPQLVVSQRRSRAPARCAASLRLPCRAPVPPTPLPASPSPLPTRPTPTQCRRCSGCIAIQLCLLSHLVTIQLVYCDAILPSLTAALYCNTHLCPAIQSSPPSLLLQYNSWPIYPILQYSFSQPNCTPKGHVTIQFPLSQYNLAQISPCTNFFFSFFIIYIFFLLFPATEKYTKTNIYLFFFSFSRTLK